MTIGSYEGALIMVTPVSENVYKRLYALYSRMVHYSQPTAGLNPRGYRYLFFLCLFSFMMIHGYSQPPRGLYMFDNLVHFAYLSQLKLSKRVVSSAFVGSGPNLGPPGPRMILDGDMLLQFEQMSRHSQNELSYSIGSNTQAIHDDLIEVLAGMEYL